MSEESKALKAKEVAVIEEKVKKAKSIVIVDYRGLTVSQDTALRCELRKANVEYKVLKNRLVLRAMNDAGYKGFDKVLEGPTAVAFSYDDAVAPARILNDSAKSTNKLTLKGGVVEGKSMNATELTAIAAIPSKPILVAQLLGMLTNPMRSLAVAFEQIAKAKA